MTNSLSLSLSLLRPRHLFAAALLSLQLAAANYVVPQTYDNIVNGQQSISYGIIRQSLPVESGNLYTIGGVTARYKCLVTPKITCRSSPNITMSAVVSEVNLKDPISNETLNIYGSDVRVEDDAANFYICAAAYGGITYDELTIGLSGSDLSYDYRANTKARSFVYFTGSGTASVPASTSNTSYLTVQYQQVCQ